MKKIIWHVHQRSQQTLNIGNCLPGRNIINVLTNVSEPHELSFLFLWHCYTETVSSSRVFQALIQRLGDFIELSFLILGVNVFLLYSVFFLICHNIRELKNLKKPDQQNTHDCGRFPTFGQFLNENTEISVCQRKLNC